MKLFFTKTLFMAAFSLLAGTTSAQTYAIIADKLIDPKNAKTLDNPVVIVRHDRIVEVLFNKKAPDSTIVINLKGYTLLPGMMDVHTHILADGSDYEKDLYGKSPSYRALRAVKHLNMALQRGITTVRDVCSEGAGFADIEVSQAVDSSFITGSRVIPAGRGIAATGFYYPSPANQNWILTLPSGTQYATGHDECVKAVREQVSHGLRWVKLYADWRGPTFSYDEIKAIVDEAHKFHVNVAAHSTTKEGTRMAIMAGVRSIEHGVAFNDSLITLALAHHVYWCPTISVLEHFKMPLDTVYKYLGRANKVNLKIVMGTDIGSFPWANNNAKELEYYVKNAGFSPMDAIRTATINPAELLYKQNELGEVKKSFVADIIAVKGDPLTDITLLQNVAFVMKDGKIYKQPGN
jgi:imidazolonepropionase-like amidohydrolase